MALLPPSHNTKRHTIDILFAVALQLHPVEPLDTYHVHIQLLKAQRTYSRNVQIRIECSMQAWYCNNGRKRAQKEQPNNYCGTIIRSLIGPLSHIGHARTHTHTLTWKAFWYGNDHIYKPFTHNPTECMKITDAHTESTRKKGTTILHQTCKHYYTQYQLSLNRTKSHTTRLLVVQRDRKPQLNEGIKRTIVSIKQASC